MTAPTPRYLVLVMRRPGFDESLVAAHLRFLDGLRGQGRLELSRGFGDRSGGAYLLRGLVGLDEARAVVAQDPLVLQGASDAVVHEWLAH